MKKLTVSTLLLVATIIAGIAVSGVIAVTISSIYSNEVQTTIRGVGVLPNSMTLNPVNSSYNANDSILLSVTLDVIPTHDQQVQFYYSTTPIVNGTSSSGLVAINDPVTTFQNLASTTFIAPTISVNT